MKKCCIFAVLLVLTLMTLMGCGCRNSRPAETTMPTTLPPVTTLPMETTSVPTTMATEPSTQATIPDGNGPLSTDTTAETNSGITGSIE